MAVEAAVPRRQIPPEPAEAMRRRVRRRLARGLGLDLGLGQRGSDQQMGLDQAWAAPLG